MLSDSQCAAYFDDATQHFYGGIHVCANNPGGAVDCITHGDSGGPLMVRNQAGLWRLIGITSSTLTEPTAAARAARSASPGRPATRCAIGPSRLPTHPCPEAGVAALSEPIPRSTSACRDPKSRATSARSSARTRTGACAAPVPLLAQQLPQLQLRAALAHHPARLPGQSVVLALRGERPVLLDARFRRQAPPRRLRRLPADADQVVVGRVQRT